MRQAQDFRVGVTTAPALALGIPPESYVRGLCAGEACIGSVMPPLLGDSSRRHNASMATIYFTASSLDGFIAGPGHSLEWLLSRDIDPGGPQSFAAFTAGVGAAVMGANTYQWILDHGDEPWTPELPSWVMTHRTFVATDADIRFSSASIAAVHAAAVDAAGDRDVWLVGGGALVGQFHDVGLLDEVHVQYAPATLGSGAPLLPRRIDLDLVILDRNRDFACGRYRVRR